MIEISLVRNPHASDLSSEKKKTSSFCEELVGSSMILFMSHNQILQRLRRAGKKEEIKSLSGLAAHD